MIFKGGLVDKMKGVPPTDDIHGFFDKAGNLDEKDFQMQEPSGSGEGLKVEKTHEVPDGKSPSQGQKVKVHYTGKLTNGNIFDSSVQRGDPFEFVLGVGQVIKGWDEGFKQLRKGEKAIITCPPEYGYGSREIPGVIPANSTLIFEVELLDFK